MRSIEASTARISPPIIENLASDRRLVFAERLGDVGRYRGVRVTLKDRPSLSLFEDRQ